MDLSTKVMWKFVEKQGLSKEELRRRWDKEKACNWKQRKIQELDPKEWDIVVTREAITDKRMKIVEAGTPECSALHALERIRNNHFGHVSSGIDQATYEKVVKKSQEQYKILLDTDEQECIDEITSSKNFEVE